MFQARGIFCLNPKRIAIAGKIRVFCFDKTGTLTKEGLDFIGAQSVVRSISFGPTFGPLKSPANGDDMEPLTVHGLATCHAVTKFGDQFVGNQVEVSFQNLLNEIAIYVAHFVHIYLLRRLLPNVLCSSSTQ